jgi:hypothetical protein
MIGASRIAGGGGGGPIWGSAVFVAGLILAAGLLLCASRPKLGLRLVAFGLLSGVLLTFWMFFITLPVAIAVGAIAYSRSRRATRPIQPQPA